MHPAARFSGVTHLAVLLAAGCATTIPVSDTDPPEIRLTITGPGVGSQTMSNPPREHWTGPGGSQFLELASNTEYDFILSVGDDGGVARAHLRIPDSLAVVDVAPSDVTVENMGLTRHITLLGSRDDPRTGLVISGTFRTPDNRTLLSFQFQTEGDDFGGASGSTNQRFMNVDAVVTVD